MFYVYTIRIYVYICNIKFKRMHVFVEIEVPTVHQLNSLTKFGLGFESNANGSFIAKKHFNTISSANKYLIEKALLNSDSHKEFKEMKSDIMNHGRLTIDAATAYIIKENNA